MTIVTLNGRSCLEFVLFSTLMLYLNCLILTESGLKDFSRLSCFFYLQCHVMFNSSRNFEQKRFNNTFSDFHIFSSLNFMLNSHRIFEWKRFRSYLSLYERGSVEQISLDQNCLFHYIESFVCTRSNYFFEFSVDQKLNNAFNLVPKFLAVDQKF